MISTIHTILSNIYISRLARYVDEITGNQQYGAACTKSTTCAFCIHKTLGKKMEIPLSCTPAIYKFQQGQWFSLEGVLNKILIKFVIPLETASIEIKYNEFK